MSGKLIIAIILMWLLGSPGLAAACAVVSGANQVINFDLGTIVVPGNLANGATIKSFQVETTGFSTDNYCPRTRMDARAKRSAVAGYDKVFETGVAGVGYQLTYNIPTHNFDAVANQVSEEYVVWPGLTWGYIFTLHMKAGIKLIKTGEIRSGSFATGQWGYAGLINVSVVAISNVTGGAVRLGTCSTIASQVINLGKISAKIIEEGVNAAGEKIDIPVNCDSGMKIYAKLSGVAPSGSTADGLIQNSGTAAGVAVQMIDGKNSPLKLGGKVEVVNNGANTVYRVGARAYKIGAVGAGTINAQATLTITYE